MADISDAEAVRATLAGDPYAFSLLVQRYLRMTHAIAFAVLGNYADAEDVAQDTFLLAYRHLAECRSPERFRAWLLRIARNRAYNVADLIRVRRHEPLAETMHHPPAANPAEQAEQRQARAALERAISQLKPIRREVLLLHDLEGLTHAEIGSVLGTSELMCRKHLMQARQQLRAMLAHFRTGHE